MLISIAPSQVVDSFGLACVTYFPRSADSHLRSEVAHFLSDVGLPESSFFSSRLDLEDESMERIDDKPTLKTTFEADGAECPPESEGWEILGVFNYATIAIDPSGGRIYSFPEGEENYIAMNADLSSFVHSLIALEQGMSEYKGTPVDEKVNLLASWSVLGSRFSRLTKHPSLTKTASGTDFSKKLASECVADTKTDDYWHLLSQSYVAAPTPAADGLESRVRSAELG